MIIIIILLLLFFLLYILIFATFCLFIVTLKSRYIGYVCECVCVLGV